MWTHGSDLTADQLAVIVGGCLYSLTSTAAALVLARHNTERRIVTINYARYWKAIIAFLVLVVTNLATRFVTNGEPLPTTLKDWGVCIGTTALGTWLVYQKRNEPLPDDSPAAPRHARADDAGQQ